MVQDPEARHGYNEKWLKREYPLTYRYLLGFRSVLESRAAYKKYHAEGGHPFYSMFNISEDTFAPYKVAWRRMGNDMRACMLSKYIFEPMQEKLVIPSDTVTIVSLDSEIEAFYLVALLNSIPARAAVYSYSPSGRGLGTPAILKDLRIDNYNSKNPLHRSVASIGKELTEQYGRKKTNPQTIAKSEEALNSITAEYWGLNQTELMALKEAVETRELGASGQRSSKVDEDIHSLMFDIGTSGEASKYVGDGDVRFEYIYEPNLPRAGHADPPFMRVERCDSRAPGDCYKGTARDSHPRFPRKAKAERRRLSRRRGLA